MGVPLPFPLEGSTDISHGGIEGEEGRRRRRTDCMLPVHASGSRLGPHINFLLIDHFTVVFSLELICKGFSNNSTALKHPEAATASST